METVIAIGVVAILLTTFLAVFGPATQSIRRAISSQDANRLTSALERELQLLRADTDSSYETAFEKAFDWILESGDANSAILLYNYRGDPTDIRNDGSFEPYDGTSGQSGRDYVLQPGVRRKGDSALEDDLQAVEGPVFYVRMTQLVFDGGSLIKGESGQIVDPHNVGKSFTTADDFPEAVIVFSADFFALRSNDVNYINNLDLSDENSDGRPDSLGRPLFSRNLGVRR
jgi:type II secretory pathway pseudopilin PulG